tara:strand:+ start:2759 stop:3478 length:720 start_codon:yes stop_codon:yes gene_type:complete
MASQNLNVGTSANDETGHGLRTAFINVRKMFAEIYGITYSSDTQDISGTTFGIPLGTIADQAANTVIVRDANSSGDLSAKAVTNQQILIGDGTGFTAAALSGDVTMTNAGVVTIANDSVEHAMLENRYTAKATSTATGSQNIDASTATTFLLTGNVATATLTLQNMKLGQVIDIVLSGTLSSAAITLADDFTSSTIRRVGSTELDTSATNVITVTCIDDTDSAALIHYTINTFQTDTTP